MEVLDTSVYNTAQNNSDNLPSYLQTTIIAQILFIGGKRGPSLSSRVGRTLVYLVHDFPVLHLRSAVVCIVLSHNNITVCDITTRMHPFYLQISKNFWGATSPSPETRLLREEGNPVLHTPPFNRSTAPITFKTWTRLF